MSNPYGITLDDASLRWAAAEGVPEAVIAAICLLGEKSVDEIVARLTTAELEQVITIVGRSPRGYPPGACAALKEVRLTRSMKPPPRMHSTRCVHQPSRRAHAQDTRAQTSELALGDHRGAADRLRGSKTLRFRRDRHGLKCLVRSALPMRLVGRETSGTSHWWKNLGDATVILYVGDVLHDKTDHNM